MEENRKYRGEWAGNNNINPLNNTMRKRTNMNGLVSHTTPSGASYQSGKNKCEQNLKKLQKLLDESYQIAGIEVRRAEEHPRKVVLIISGWEEFGTITVSYRDYLADYQDKSIKIVKKIY